MYCKKCNSLLNEDNICPVCESNTSQKENNELSQAIEELKAGNQEAFNVFYNYTSKYVYSRAKTFSSDEQTANDVMQEVYISAFKNINSLKSNDSVFAWLRTITFNASSRIMKKNKNEIILSEENEEMLEVLPDENEQIEEDYMNKQDIEIIHACINRLSEEHRIVLLAYYYDNLKVEEIADLLQISSGTVKSRLYTARKKLKEYIEEEENKNGYKLHSFSGLSLALALRKLLQDNMNNCVISNDVLYRSICKKLNTPIDNSSITNIVKPKPKYLNAISRDLKGKIVQQIAETGIKKIVLSAVATVVAAGIISGTIVVVTSNLNNVNSKEDSSVITNSQMSDVVNNEKEETSSEGDETQNSNKNPSDETEEKPPKENITINTSQPSDCIIYYTPAYAHTTVIINQKTTYFGYPGYFTMDSKVSNANLVKYGLGINNKSAYLCPTEFINSAYDETIWFVINKSNFSPDEIKKLVNNSKGVGKVTVNAIDYNSFNSKLPSDCVIDTYPYKTIKLYEKTTYYGFPGYFTLDDNIDHADLEKYGLGTKDDPVCLCISEYYDIFTAKMVRFIINADVVYPNDLAEYIDGGNLPMCAPVNVSGNISEEFEQFINPLNEYLFSSNNGSASWQDAVNFYTTEINPTIEKEICLVFKEKYGYEAAVTNFHRIGKYYIDDSGKLYDIYLYHLNGPWKYN